MTPTAAAIAPLILLVAVLLISHRLWPSSGSRSGQSRTGESIDRDDERYWLGGIIYNNADDPDLFVPKRFGYGRTVNFGHPLGKVILIAPLLLALLPLVLRSLGGR